MKFNTFCKIAFTLALGIFLSSAPLNVNAAPPALSSLTASPGVLSPTFNGSILNYTLQLGSTDVAATITPVGAGDVISVLGAQVTSSGVGISAPPGHTTQVPITSTALGVTTNYVVNIVHNVGLTPIFSGKITTDGIFTFSVVNYDSTYSWLASSTAGSATIDSTGKVTVTGIPQGSSASVSVTSSKDDYSPKSATMLSDVIPVVTKTALTPAFSAPSSSSSGFTVNFTNYDSLFNLVIKTSAGQVTSGSPTGSTLPITVSGLTAGQSATVTITTSRAGYYNGSGSVTGGTTPGTGLTPGFSGVSPTSTGFTVSIINYDSAYTFNITSSAGTVAKGLASGSTLPITVSNLSAGQSATVTATAVRSGFTSLSATVTGTAASGTALNPTFGIVTSNVSGFSASMSNYDSKFTYSASSTAGTASVGSTGTVNVSGLTPGTSATVTVRTSRTGYSAGSGTVTGSPSTAPARNPLFSPPTQTSTGFTVQVSNYDPTFQWSVSASPGSATIDQTGLITVVNLNPGTSASITVSTTKAGFASGSAIARGSAKMASAPTATPSRTPQAPGQSAIRPSATVKSPTSVKNSKTTRKKPTIGKKPTGTHAIIITCSNGSTTKRIVGYNPRCPTGFVRKG